MNIWTSIGRSRNWLCCALLFPIIASALCGVAQAQGPIEFKIDDVNFGDGRVHFRAGTCDVQSAPIALDPQQTTEEQTGTYDVSVDLRRTTLASYGYFVYGFYVRRRGELSASHTCLFRVQATPSGTFLDKLADVSFHVGVGTHVEDGTLSIPVHNTSFLKPILQAQPSVSLIRVPLTGESPITLSIANLLPDLPVVVNGVVANPENPGFWQGTPQAVLHFPRPGPATLQPGQKLDAGIRLTLTPDRWHALGASIFPLAPDKPHETIHLTADFNTPGGIPGALEVAVPVRFTPSFWSLLVAVVIGGLVGSGLASLASLLPSHKTAADGAGEPANNTGAAPLEWWIAIIIAILAGVVAEGLAIALVYANSQVRLFGFELDPYQLLPAALIGALVGLIGFRNADDLLSLFKKA
ncbi:MAG: hypothetical protein ACR2IF_07225 [Terriglobales bacterium]